LVNEKRQSDTELVERAKAAYRNLRLDEALEHYRAAEAERPNDYEVLLGLSRTLSRMRRTKEATAAAQRCVEIDPGRSEGHASLGILHWLAGRNDEAISALEQAVHLAPGAADPHLTLAQVFSDTGQRDVAQRELETARGLIAAIQDDDLRNWTLAFAWHVETYLRLAEGDKAGAMAAAQETVDLEDANRYAASLALSNMGIVHARARRYAEAIECFERARQSNPYLHRIGVALGRLLLVSHEYERAAKVLAEVTQDVQDNGSTRQVYATALAKLGRREEARTQHRQALAEGLGGVGGILSRWQVFWLSRWGRYALLGVVVAAILAWVLLGEPSSSVLTLIAVAVVIIALQWRFGRGKR